MRLTRVVPGKHGTTSLMLALQEAEISMEVIPVHMHQGQNATKQLRYRGETPMVMVQAGKINKITTLCTPTEEDWSHYTAYDNDLRYINSILSVTEETPIYHKELIKNRYVKPFQKGCLELENFLIFYYYTPHTDRVRQLRLRVVPVNFRRVVMSACHVSPLSGNIHDKITLLITMAGFLCPMVNKEVVQFIRVYVHLQLVNSCSNEAHQMLHTIESDNPFDVAFIDFWEPGDIPDRYGYRKILTCLDRMKGFGIGASSVMKKITSDQVARWDFGNFFVTFGLPKIIVVNADGLFS